MNEFIARKGLISLKSSSFEETVHVEGSLSSPSEALLTASWATNTVTASYVTQNGYHFSTSTSAQSITTANVYKTITFDSTIDNSSAWIRSGNEFTCSLGGKYKISLETRMEKSSGGSGVSATRLMLNGLEISGSYHGETLPTNGVGQNLFSNVIVNVNSGSGLIAEFAASTANIGINTMPSIGTTVANCSVKIHINKV